MPYHKIRVIDVVVLNIRTGSTSNTNDVDEYNHGFTERELDNPAYENFHDELSNSVT